MGLKKALKKVKKTANKVGNEVVDVVGDAVDWVEVAVDDTTGAIDKVLDTVVDFDADDLNKACKWADKQLKEARATIDRLAEKAVNAAYKAVYDKYIKDYGELVSTLATAQEAIGGKVLGQIRDDLVAGRFSSVDDALERMLVHDAMQPAIQRAHKLMGTCIVVAADLSVGGNLAGGASAGLSGVVGLTRSLGPDSIMGSAFAVAGGSIGYTASLSSKQLSGGVGGQLGISVGFLARDPLNIGGVFIDVAGQIGASYGVVGLAFGFPPPSAKPPYVTVEPTTGFLRGAVSTSADPTGSLSIGGSYTWIIQKFKA